MPTKFLLLGVVALAGQMGGCSVNAPATENAQPHQEARTIVFIAPNCTPIGAATVCQWIEPPKAETLARPAPVKGIAL